MLEFSGRELIGASLYKPHTSGTALHTYVCIYACLQLYTVILNERIEI